MNDLRKNTEIVSAFAFGEEQHVTLPPHFQDKYLSEFLKEKGHTGIKVRKIAPTIEDTFIKLMLENQ